MGICSCIDNKQNGVYTFLPFITFFVDNIPISFSHSLSNGLFVNEVGLRVSQFLV